MLLLRGFSAAQLFLLLLALSSCAIQPQDTHDARTRATEQSMASAQQPVDQQDAQAKVRVADYDHRTETWRSPFQAYADCNKRASRAVAMQSGDPASLAIAARNLCRTTEEGLRTAIYAAYDDNANVGIDTMEKLRRVILENNTSDIVAARAAATAPRRAPAPDTPPADRRI